MQSSNLEYAKAAHRPCNVKGKAMSHYNDASGNLSKRRVAKRLRESSKRVEMETLAVAKKIGHQGEKAVADEMRSRGVSVDLEFVRRVLRYYS